MGKGTSRFPRSLIAVVVCLTMTLAGWGTLRWVHHLESDNSFCNSCHVDGRPLHTNQFQQLAGGKGQTLAAAHSVRVRLSGERPRPMRCIDCHTGIGFTENARFHWVAFRDLVVYVAGQGSEPDNLSRPMPDVNCTRCHTRLNKGRFHTIRAHQGEMKTLCSECHRAHPVGRGPAHTDPEHSRSLCARCHPGLADQVLQLAGALPEQVSPSP